MSLAVTVMFSSLSLMTIGTGVFIWVKQRHLPCLTLRITALTCIALSCISIVILANGHPLSVILGILLMFMAVILLFIRIFLVKHRK